MKVGRKSHAEIGLLYITSTYDYPLLFQQGFTQSDVDKSVGFYLSMYQAPLSVKALVHSVFGLGLLMYVSVEIPNMRVLAAPEEKNIVHRAVFDAEDTRKVENYEFYPLTGRERASVVQVIGATNVIITALLAGVLLMQGGEWYSTRLDRIAENKQRQEMIAKLGADRSVEKKVE